MEQAVVTVTPKSFPSFMSLMLGIRSVISTHVIYEAVDGKFLKSVFIEETDQIIGKRSKAVF